MAKLSEEAKKTNAVLNNIALYEAVFRCGNISSILADDIWYCLKETPPLYSNLITQSPEWQPDDRFAEINANYERENWSKLSIKDSFARLHLTSYGFQRLFDADWMYLPAEKFVPVNKSRDIAFEIVSDGAGLAAWTRAWDRNEALAQKIFCKDMLQDSDLSLIAGYQKDQIVCGCVVNRSDAVLGISNFFPADKVIDRWSNVIEFIFDAVSRADIVGYEQPQPVTMLRELGVEPIGTLTVWLKKNIQ